ncbi:MAG TPA: hypothetical protein VF939_16955 [Puia sp.]
MYTLSSKCLRKNPETRSALPPLFLLSLFTLLLLSSCKKGDTGPAGATGSANVIYSAWFTPATYLKDTVFDVYGFSYTKATTDITQAVLDSGVVLTYGKLDGYTSVIWPTAQVSQLPIVVSYKFSPGGITYNDTWTATATAGNLKIRFVDDQNYYNGISNAHQFRYIVIPGGAKSAVASVKPGIQTGNGKQLDAVNVQKVISNYQQMSYAEVCQLLNIPE